MKTPYFGPAGNSESFYAAGYHSTDQAFAWLKGLGLTAFEYPMGRGATVSEETARKIGAEAQKHGIMLSAHAPYYINLVNPDREARTKSLGYILQTALRLDRMQGERMVVHVGSAKGLERKDALHNAAEGLHEALAMLEENGLSARICVETMGKPAQIGDLNETLAFCAGDERLIPCLDFAHLHALGNGCLHSTEDFARILDTVEETLGLDRARSMHIHFSTVEYGANGEKRHRTFQDEGFGPRFEHLAPLLKTRGYAPTVICESRGTMAEDALTMQTIYNSLTL